MLTLDAIKTALVAVDNKEAKWVFYVYDKNGVVYSFASEPLGAVAWATGISWDSGISWDDGTNLSTIVLTDFSGIELRRNMAENTIIAPSEVSFNISNAGNVLAFSDFKGGTVKIELYFSNSTYGDRKIAGWNFRIKTAQPGYQNLKITAEDFLQHYLRGDYPNTRIPNDVFSSSRSYENDALCVPVPFGTAYVPLRDVYITDAGYIMLGDPAFTYTITKIRNPRSAGTRCEWDSGSFNFTQSTKADVDAVNWRVFQAVIADSDNNGVADAPGFWGTPGGPILDPPVEFTRSDTATMTNPADVIEFVLKDMGVPAARIDATTFATAHATFDGWGLTFNGAFWYKQDRQKVLAQLLNQCHSCLDIGETIQLRVLSAIPQGVEITDADVLRTVEQGEGSFSYQDIVNEDYSDSGYIAYQESGEAQDSFLKALVSPSGAATVISNEIIECPFVQDSQDVLRIGILHYQRRLLKEAEVGFTTKGTRIALQPDDVITINDANYGGSYTVLIDSVRINKDLSIQFQCSKFSDTFDDWDELSPVALAIATDDTEHSWRPTISGPVSPGAVTPPNAIHDILFAGVTGDVGLSGLVTGGDDIRIWAGDSTPEDAPFRVYESGAVVATSATIEGDITATTGFLGGWVVDGSTIRDVVGFVGLSSLVTLEDDIRIWAGHITPASAPFYVTEAGALVATSATIAGDITATTGYFNTVTLGKTGVVSGTLTLQMLAGGGDTYINYGKTDFTNVDSGFIIGIDDSDGDKAKVYFGNDLQWLSWDGNTLEYTNGLIIEPTIRLYVGGEIKTSDRAVDGSASSTGIKITKDGIYAAGADQNEANANVRILATGDAFFKGDITADTGYIGGEDGWVIASKTLTGTADSKIVSGILESTDWAAGAGSQINLFASSIKFGGWSDPKFSISPDGTMTAVGGVFKSSSSGERTQIDSDGITIYVAGDIGQYNEFDYNDGTLWGSGARIQIGNPDRNVPIYFPSYNNYADIHFSNRPSTPTGAAEIGDVAVVSGALNICTVAGTPGTWETVGGVGFTWSLIIADPAPAVAGNGYICDTSGAAFTVTLPAAPAEGDIISFTDGASTFDTANLTIGRAALKIMGLAEDMTVLTKNAAFSLVYSDATNGWRIA